MNKSSCTGAVTDKQSKKLVVKSLFKNCNTVWVAVDDILAIFGESLISRIVYSIVDFVGAFFDSVGSGIRNFDTHIALNISNNVDRMV